MKTIFFFLLEVDFYQPLPALVPEEGMKGSRFSVQRSVGPRILCPYAMTDAPLLTAAMTALIAHVAVQKIVSSSSFLLQGTSRWEDFSLCSESLCSSGRLVRGVHSGIYIVQAEHRA
ncbi:hypothetical protein M378DRAFT_163907 [Amanita muscaria Koide BX008]|uniref:Uncharacterized protein n=1 Tax=Amanita muscaria (strain Koide BX008) TaxID=946122 RepID=A0A0C2WQK0_AMAMK|nr:hypothetical protein M378DRAFT_163907 [Amanita muscaria Koide BX008]